jgi:hypothetical protein
MITGSNNIGRVSTLERVEKHEGSYDIAHMILLILRMRMV